MAPSLLLAQRVSRARRGRRASPFLASSPLFIRF
jgi:hypothetical protein